MIPVQEEKVQKTPTSLRRLFTIYSKGKISSPFENYPEQEENYSRSLWMIVRMKG